MCQIYKDAVTETAYSIFLNFYKATEQNLVLNENDTNNMISTISKEYNKELPIVEKDITLQMKKFISNIPNLYLINLTKITYH